MAVSQAGSRNTAIEQLLQQEIACARTLVHLLEQEYAALAQRDIGRLDTIIPEKRNAIADLESLGQRRETLLAQRHSSTSDAATYTGDGENKNPFSGDSRQSDLWDELRSLAQQCQEKNQVNGRIVEIGYRQSRVALDVLHGVAPCSELYDSSGRTTQSASKKPIVQV